MSTLSEHWKSWEGRVADGKFPLRQWLGGSDHGAVFLTDRTSSGPQKAAIKLIPADSREAAQLSRWAEASKLSHPHLIRIFEYGRFQVDDTRLLYVVTEYAEENLAEILPLRPLTPDEASGMLGPTAEALAYLHKSGFVHGRIKPSNIMAVGDQLKISADRPWRRAHAQRLRCARDGIRGPVSRCRHLVTWRHARCRPHPERAQPEEPRSGAAGRSRNDFAIDS
jgi:hypothetical protein